MQIFLFYSSTLVYYFNCSTLIIEFTESSLLRPARQNRPGHLKPIDTPARVSKNTANITDFCQLSGYQEQTAMDVPFTPQGTIELTSAAADASTPIPANADTVVLYNGAANPVYFRFDSTAAVVPNGGAVVAGLGCIAPGSTQSFSVPRSTAPGVMHFIAKTAGGILVASFGNGA